MNEGISHHKKINEKLLRLFGVGSRSEVLTDLGRFRIRHAIRRRKRNWVNQRRESRRQLIA
jgi:hypothetical protein